MLRANRQHIYFLDVDDQSDAISKSIQAKHADKLCRILSNLDVASCADDLDLPAYGLHELKGSRKGVWSITVQAKLIGALSFAFWVRILGLSIMKTTIKEVTL